MSFFETQHHDLTDEADDTLFSRIMANHGHVLQPLLPDRHSTPCSPRKRSQKTLLNKSTHLNNDDFLIRMLYERLVTCIRSNRSPVFYFFSFYTCILYMSCVWQLLNKRMMMTMNCWTKLSGWECLDLQVFLVHNNKFWCDSAAHQADEALMGHVHRLASRHIDLLRSSYWLAAEIQRTGPDSSLTTVRAMWTLPVKYTCHDN